ncbi:gamma carbonic anhydrase family protein [Algihabitans albus]|uniref:gamma carbonic anhydrase family protein n=1 Tax=Algihabitans albus TaxID=2164067 RepID=UPI000E5CD030|nr:gamma carbonic anhydrase family protein [Algihabitans albus]
MSPVILSYRGAFPRIHPDAFVAETAVVIGDVEIGPGSSIWYGCVLRGDVNTIRIGARTNIQDGTVIHVNRPRDGSDYRESGGGMATLIGDQVTVGHSALLHACTLEDRAFVGMRATVMDQAVVARQGMVAAGALVTPRKQVASGQLWSGSPAKPMRDLSQEEIDGFGPQADHYARLGATYLAERKERNQGRAGEI